MSETILLVRAEGSLTDAFHKNKAESFEKLIEDMGKALEGEVPRDRSYEVLEVTVVRAANVKRVSETKVSVSVEAVVPA